MFKKMTLPEFRYDFKSENGRQMPTIHGLYLSREQMIEGDIKKHIMENKITFVPSGAKVFIPKHITYPRSHLRSFLLETKGSIKRHVHSADLAVYDPDIIDSLVTDQIRYQINVYDRENDTEVLRLSTQKSVNTSVIPITVESKGYRYLTVHKYEEEYLDDLLETIKTNPEIQWISYDDLHRSICKGRVMTDNEFRSILNLYSSGKSANYETASAMASRYAYEDNEVYLTKLLLFVFYKSIFKWSFKNIYNSTFYYNLLKRYPTKINKKYFAKNYERFSLDSKYSLSVFYGASSVYVKTGDWITLVNHAYAALKAAGNEFDDDFKESFRLGLLGMLKFICHTEKLNDFLSGTRIRDYYDTISRWVTPKMIIKDYLENVCPKDRYNRPDIDIPYPKFHPANPRFIMNSWSSNKIFMSNLLNSDFKSEYIRILNEIYDELED